MKRFKGKFIPTTGSSIEDEMGDECFKMRESNPLGCCCYKISCEQCIYHFHDPKTVEIYGRYKKQLKK